MAKKKKQKKHVPVNELLKITIQICEDAALMAANDVFHCGPKRADPFCLSYKNYVAEILKLIGDDTDDIEYSKAVVDRRLTSIVGAGKLREWDVRYNRK